MVLSRIRNRVQTLCSTSADSKRQRGRGGGNNPAAELNRCGHSPLPSPPALGRSAGRSWWAVESEVNRQPLPGCSPVNLTWVASIETPCAICISSRSRQCCMAHSRLPTPLSLLFCGLAPEALALILSHNQSGSGFSKNIHRCGRNGARSVVVRVLPLSGTVRRIRAVQGFSDRTPQTTEGAQHRDTITSFPPWAMGDEIGHNEPTLFGRTPETDKRDESLASRTLLTNG